MSYINTYTPPAPVPELEASARWGPDPYDINFAFPLPPDGALENDRVKLTPFIPRVFAEAYLEQVTAHPALQRWLPHTHTSLAQFLSFVELAVRRDPAWALFAVLDTARPALNPVEGVEGAFAGVIGLLHTSRENLATEIGWVVTFPAFQRSYVTSTAAGLLLRWCLEPGPHGLALRRVQWMANVRNGPSVRAAERLGFRMEGVLRWNRVLAEGKDGNQAQEGDPRPGRDSAVLSICWDDWEGGVRETIKQAMERE